MYRALARMLRTPQRAGWIGGLLLLIALLGARAATESREGGSGELRFVAEGTEIRVFTYRPPACAKPSILFVFHGLNRNAEGVRTKARGIADEACLMVFAPLFDRDRFPNWRYHRAGVVRDGRIQPQALWTAPVLLALLELARKEVGNPDAKLYLFGHSAGGQFLSRSTAYSAFPGIDRIVIANPSVYAAPLLDTAAPYGFAEVFSADEAQARLQSYLALPITIYLGEEDTDEKYLVKNEQAMRLGSNRLERGRAVYGIAKEVARARGWAFNWTLVEAPGVGHSSGGMLRSPAMRRALGLDLPSPLAQPAACVQPLCPVH